MAPLGVGPLPIRSIPNALCGPDRLLRKLRQLILKHNQRQLCSLMGCSLAHRGKVDNTMNGLADGVLGGLLLLLGLFSCSAFCSASSLRTLWFRFRAIACPILSAFSCAVIVDTPIGRPTLRTLMYMLSSVKGENVVRRQEGLLGLL